MLVLTRSTHETIVILIPGRPQPVEIKVVEVRGGKVRLGIEAEGDIIVHRNEVYQAILQGQSEVPRTTS